jgi:hypothetical protein
MSFAWFVLLSELVMSTALLYRSDRFYSMMQIN